MIFFVTNIITGIYASGWNKMKNKKSYLLLIAGAAITFTMTGCIAPSMQSMGSAPMITAHQPKTTPSGEKQIDLSVEAYGMLNTTGLNVEQVNAGGGAVSFGFHPAGAISPLFVNAAVAGVAGSLQFGCTDLPCADTYQAWLGTDDGDENQTFWSLQERLIAGAEFNLGSHFFLGAAGGIQFYQGGGDYESMRDRLEDIKLVKNIDGKADWRPTASAWLGPRFGENGNGGTLTLEYSVTFAEKVKEWNTLLGISYFHPSGFHGGVFTTTNAAFAASLGKTFQF